MATAVTLSFAQVFFVALLAFLFHKEAFGPHRISAIVVGFAGVLIVMRPGVSDVGIGAALIPVAGAFAAAIAVTSVRALSQTESTMTLLAYQSIFVGLLSGFAMLWLWVTLTLWEAVFLLLMGALATGANWAGVHALRLGETGVVSNVEYIKLVYAVILGFVILLELPDAFDMLGAVVIMGSAIYMLRRERNNRLSTVA